MKSIAKLNQSRKGTDMYKIQSKVPGRGEWITVCRRPKREAETALRRLTKAHFPARIVKVGR